MTDPQVQQPSSAKPPIWRRKWFIGVSVLVLIVIGASLSGSSDTDESAGSVSTPQAAPRGSGDDAAANDNSSTGEPTTTAPPAEPASPFDTFGDGTWVVKDEINPGTYRAPFASDCYWARLKNFDGDLDSISANGTPSGPEVVTIKKSDRGFETAGCGTWTSDLSRLSASTSRIEDGTWIVGVDLKPGTYRSDPDDSCYWARLRDFEGDLDSIIANDLPSGRAIVTISKSDKGFHTSGCGTWNRT